jgi:predicted transcriptional regulator of viral defense system
MEYLNLKRAFFDKVCFSSHQIHSWYPGFNNNNLTRWVKKDFLVKLRNGHYAFPEYLEEPASPFYIANRIYRPSYISLHSALAFYGLIPEAVVQVTSISSLKTVEFKNRFGTFSYKSVQPALIFGYDQKPFIKSITMLVAQPEKALLDLLYLYPFYNSESEIKALRFDEDIIHELINLERLNDYTERIKSKALTKRVKLMIETYFL